MKLVELIKLPFYGESNGSLVIAEGEDRLIPFAIKRVFNIKANIGDIRGRHAHRYCTQLLICSLGEVKVTCYDSFATEVYSLNKPNLGLLIKPGIWADQEYLENNTIITALCDRPYEESDYIHNYDEFKAFKAIDNKEN